MWHMSSKSLPYEETSKESVREIATYVRPDSVYISYKILLLSTGRMGLPFKKGRSSLRSGGVLIHLKSLLY